MNRAAGPAADGAADARSTGVEDFYRRVALELLEDVPELGELQRMYATGR